MSAFVPMATRFSVSPRTAAKVAKPAKAGADLGGQVQAGPGEVAKVAKVEPLGRDEFSQVSQANPATPEHERLDTPALSQLSQVSQPGNLNSEIQAPTAPPAEWWLADIARSIAEAIAAGADRDADPAGCLVLVRPTGERLVVTPGTFAALDAVGLLPPLPPALARSRNAATARPPCWSDPDDLPVEGDRCRCGGHRWWTYAPKPDGWCCTTCRPPVHLRPEAVRVVAT